MGFVDFLFGRQEKLELSLFRQFVLAAAGYTDA